MEDVKNKTQVQESQVNDGGGGVRENYEAEVEGSSGKINKWLVIGFGVVLVIFGGVVWAYKTKVKNTVKKAVPTTAPEVRPTEGEEVIKQEEKVIEQQAQQLPPEERQLLNETDVNLDDIDKELQQIEKDLNQL